MGRSPTYSVELPAETWGPRLARAFVAELLQDARPHVVRDAQLVASELVTNAVRHGRPPVQLSVSVVDDRVRLSVRDADSSAPVVKDPPSTEPAGRGLRSVGAIASAWGWMRERGGKTVWAEIPC